MSSGGTIYSVYCSKCNSDQKKKMSWTRYIRYKVFDGKSKGQHEIDSTYVNSEPSVCPFGHKIDTKRTKIIETPDQQK